MYSKTLTIEKKREDRERGGHRERDEVRKAYGYDNIACRQFKIYQLIVDIENDRDVSYGLLAAINGSGLVTYSYGKLNFVCVISARFCISYIISVRMDRTNYFAVFKVTTKLFEKRS